jgi:ribosome-binding factor A
VLPLAKPLVLVTVTEPTVQVEVAIAAVYVTTLPFEPSDEFTAILAGQVMAKALLFTPVKHHSSVVKVPALAHFSALMVTCVVPSGATPVKV